MFAIDPKYQTSIFGLLTLLIFLVSFALLLRGVAGFVVNEDVFGLGQPFVTGFHPFPADSEIQECIGQNEVAMAQLVPAVMSPGIRYAFRIRVQNPLSTSPATNAWSLTLASEASELFDSFMLWQIDETGFLETASVPVFRAGDEALES